MADITGDSTLLGSGRSFDHRLYGLVARLTRARQRAVLGRYFEGLALGILAALATFSVLQILGGLFGDSWPGPAGANPVVAHLLIALGVGAVAVVAAFVVVNRTKPWLTTLARAADQRFALEETMSTALEFGAGGPRSVITEALIQRAQRRTPEVDAGRLAPVAFPRWMVYGAPVLAALAIGLAFVQPPAVLQNVFDGLGGGGDATPVTDIERVQTAANLHAIAAIIRQDGEQRADPTLQTLAAQMEDLANRLDAGTAANHNEVYDELARLNNLTAAAYQRAGERPGGAGDQSRLTQAALENFDPTRVAAEAEAARQAALQPPPPQANPEAADVDVPFEARVLRGGETEGAGEAGVAPGMGVRAEDINQTPGVPGNRADLMGPTDGIDPEDIYGPDGPDGPGGPVGAPAGGEMVGLAGGAEAGDVAGVGGAELFGAANPIAAIAAAGEMMLEDRNPAGGRHITLNLPPLAQLLGVDGAPPGAGGWENRTEQQVTRTPVPVPDREVIQRYFDAMMAGGRTE
ncbi:MAG: hypothetical protein IT534_00385 [Bauldia sp.]|nr:hypothetical protein [Bauldia sp.]